MLNLICKIEIYCKNGIISFDYANSIEVKTSMKNLTDTATVKVPRKMNWKGKPLADFISTGDRITVQIGYREHELQTVFNGYLKSIENSMLLVLSCENEMYRLKTINVPAQQIEQFDLKAFFEKYAPGITCETTGEVSFGSMNIEKEMTMVQALDAVMQEYSYVKGYFRDKVFYAVLNTLPHAGTKPIVFDPTRNMISQSLKYERAEDVKICVKAVSILKNNDKLEAYAPEEAMDGKTVKEGYEQRQLFCPQCKTQKEVQEFAEKMSKEWVTDKMSGNFKAFGVPYVRKGDIVEIRDQDRPELKDKCFVVEAVDYSFGEGGYRQTVTLGDQLKNL